MATKKFKFKNPNTGIVEERPDTPYFRNIAKKIQEKYDKLSDRQKAAIKARIQKRQARQADTDKKRQEVREGRAAGLTMTEIRAKRMNISADKLKKKQIATLLGMAEGMSLFIPGGVAIKAGQFIFRGKKGADAIKAIKEIVKGKQKAKKAAPKDAEGRTRRSPRKNNEVIEGKVTEKKAPAGAAATTPKVIPKPKPKPAATTPKVIPKPKPKPAKPSPSTAVAKPPRTSVKKPGKDVMEIRQARVGGKTMRTVQEVRRAIAGKSPRQMSRILKAAIAAGIITTGIAVQMMLKSKDPAAPKNAEAAKTILKDGKPTGTYERSPPVGAKPGSGAKEDRPKDRAVSPKPAVKPKVNGKANGTTKTNGAKRNGVTKTNGNAVKSTAKTNGVAVTGNGRANGTKVKRTNITASSGTGFGPKGNIFPKDSAERKILMEMYGGTGSRAAAAAEDGTQGNLSKYRSRYNRHKRL